VSVRLTPRAAREAIEGPDDAGILHARVTAPPVDGAANEALVRLVADTLRVPVTSVSITGGLTGRQKRLRLEGIEATVLQARWPGVRVT
jgi:hypothetical protein